MYKEMDDTPPVKPGDAPKVEEYEKLIKDIRKRRVDKVAAAVKPDKDILDAAGALNIALNPSAYSMNPVYKELRLK